MNPKGPEYECRIRSQIAQYANPERLVKLGPICLTPAPPLGGHELNKPKLSCER
jgi:hypothetical protein